MMMIVKVDDESDDGDYLKVVLSSPLFMFFSCSNLPMKISPKAPLPIFRPRTYFSPTVCSTAVDM